MSAAARLNFLLTNRIPRRLATRMMGRLSQIKHPIWTRAALRVWTLFDGGLALHEARRSQFSSIHECFIRELRDGVRPVDQSPDFVVSPCDAIVGATGHVNGTTVFQAKGFPYTLEELLVERDTVGRYANGVYVTLRLKSSMYHRFHAPCDCRVTRVAHVSGDTWNVNPVALQRVQQLFCKNERACVELDTGRAGVHLALVPVAAILVASLRLHCLGEELGLDYRGPSVIDCDAGYVRGQEMGYFQHGSTILVFAGPGFDLHPHLRTGQRIAMGQPLLRVPPA